MPAPKAIFEDGLHYVRPATKADRHPMRWVVKSVQKASTASNRHAPTKEEAIALAGRLTAEAVQHSPSDAALVDAFKAAATIQIKAKSEREAKKTPPAASFATTHFQCVCANPVAQVWQCVSLPGERKPVGRRTAEGKQPKQVGFPHTKGQCAILLWQRPLSNPDGAVRVFPNWQTAEEYAEGLYLDQPEDERLFWEPGRQVVYATLNIEVVFDPDVNGAARPFSLYVPRYRKPVYTAGRAKQYATDTKNADGSTFNAASAAEREAADFNKRVRALAYGEDKELSTEVMRFRTIWQAADHAIKLERDSFGSTINYTY